MSDEPAEELVELAHRMLDLARDGEAVRMDVLAARAGVAVGTLYRHFPAKSDLVAAVVEQSTHELAVRAEAAAGRVAPVLDVGVGPHRDRPGALAVSARVDDEVRGRLRAGRGQLAHRRRVGVPGHVDDLSRWADPRRPGRCPA